MVGGPKMPKEWAGNQSFALGKFEAGVKQRLKTWRAEHVCRRIWERDFTVWSSEQLPEITDRLGWLTLPETMQEETGSIRAFSDEVRADGITHVVLLGMGGSSLAPDVFMASFGNAPGYPELLVLDSTHPAQVSRVESSVDLKQTLFIVASKSGTTIEPLSFFRYFYKRMSEITRAPGRHFVAITDPGTPLEELAGDRGFRRVFTAAADVGGRFSALSAFGLVPAALIGVDTSTLLERARSMAVACGPAIEEEDNPGLTLGAVLAELALAGRDKVTLIGGRSLETVADWLEQLIAESTGKDQKGIVPVVGESPGVPEIYGPDRFFVHIALEGSTDRETAEQLSQLEDAGHPTARFVLSDKADLGAEMFRWELAVAAASSALGIHPFNQPDVQIAKELAHLAMAEGKRQERACDTTVPVESCWDRGQAIKWVINKAKPGDYIGLQAYLVPDAEIKKRLQDIRHRMRDRLHLSTTVGFGPRFLHSTGQLHKGGPRTGLFLQMIDSPQDDVAVPETEYTFCELFAAQALGDYHALLQHDRRVLRLNLGTDATQGLDLIATTIGAIK
jgi:transaldolase/glucose-6-phosphate isomerase